MTRIEVTRHVDATPEAVWDVLTDIGSADRTIRGILSVEVLTPGPYEPGFRWRETRKMFGMKATEEMVVAEAESPHSTVITADHGGTRYVSGFTVTPTGTGSSLTMHSTAITEHAPAAQRLLQMMFGRLGEGASRKMMAADLDDIAAEAEHRA